MIKLEFEISEKAYKLLLKINEKGCVEYRDRYNNIKEFKESDDYKAGYMEVDLFLARNFGGTLGTADELLEYNLIENDFDAWHNTYVVSDFGKSVISKYTTRNRTINNILNE